MAIPGIAATNNQRMSEMMVTRQHQMVLACRVPEATADESVAKQFSGITKKHDSNAYGG